MEHSSITIHASHHCYSVLVAEGIRKQAYDLIQSHIKEKPTRYFIITDSQVAKLYLQDVIASFPKDVELGHVIVPHGEGAKSFAQYENVLTKALSFHLDRRSLIIALGGGVVGDLAGFVAATYMRGIPFVQMPTTLLAHDSSVGGKVGINHPLGKNMVGAFHAPSLVIYDTECLLSLPEKEWRSGFAEVIKHGFIHSESFLHWLESHVTSLSDWDMEVLREMLIRSMEVKARIVEEDEKEQGIRAFLNFGHTLGHAIEAELGYGKMAHGEAVVIGMAFALKLSEKYYGKKIPYERYTSMLRKLGYTMDIPKELSHEALLVRMKGDKKAYNQQMNFVLIKEFGEPELLPLSGEFVSDVITKEEDEHGKRS